MKFYFILIYWLEIVDYDEFVIDFSDFLIRVLIIVIRIATTLIVSSILMSFIIELELMINV